jgi:hypothetical protein
LSCGLFVEQDKKNAFTDGVKSAITFSIHLQKEKITWPVVVNGDRSVLPFCSSPSRYAGSQSRQFFCFINPCTFTIIFCHSFIGGYRSQ